MDEWKKEEKKNDTFLDIYIYILLVSEDHATEAACLVSTLAIIVVYDYLNA